MSPREAVGEPRRRLDVDGIGDAIIRSGLRGATLEELLSEYCRRVYEAGFPMKRANMGLGTLHPRYGAHTFVWRPGQNATERKSRERSEMELESFRRSPVYHMLKNGKLLLRRRLDSNKPSEFAIFDELRAEGMTEYEARIVPYDPRSMAAIPAAETSDDAAMGVGGAFFGVFFSCATDEPAGFDDAELQQVADILPLLALAVKARSTYDVAHTVIETYLGRDAGHRVLTGGIQRGFTEAIRAVIWFCDLRGFTRLADVLPKDRTIEVLDDYLEVLARPVHQNDGQILKFLGDGFLATFDLTAQDDEAVCMTALKAAAELRQTFPLYNRERAAEGRPTMDFGLALHVGEVLYGNIGALDRLDFTVVGPAVNEASRIQALCRPLGRNVLISAAFHDAVRAGVRGMASLGFHGLRGIREPQELFTIAE